MNEDKLKYFVKMNQEIKTTIRRLEKKSRSISLARGLVFVASVVLFALGLADKMCILLRRRRSC